MIENHHFDNFQPNKVKNEKFLAFVLSLPTKKKRLDLYSFVFKEHVKNKTDSTIHFITNIKQLNAKKFKFLALYRPFFNKLETFTLVSVVGSRGL